MVGAALRNRAAVAAWLSARLDEGVTVAVVPAGERWPDATLRPAVEDLWGAGAVLLSLSRFVDKTTFSPEARLAAAAFEAMEPRLGDELRACVSGRELVDRGFGDDVEVAARHDASEVVPVLDGDAFRPEP